MRSRIWLLVLAAVVVGVAIGALLVSIVTRQQQARRAATTASAAIPVSATASDLLLIAPAEGIREG